jgi:C-methyltransferase C-terminal domain/Putative zinc binding domain/Methyltransferase domain
MATPAANRSAVHRVRTDCRGCGSRNLRNFLSLGPTPLANSFLRTPDEFSAEQSFPLDVHFCESCSLVQLVDVIDPEVLFRDYIYVTGTSDTIAAHNLEYARDVSVLLGLEPGDLVVEIASNDGSLLKCFQPYGVRTVGVEPAVNLARLAGAAGVETVNSFFNSETSTVVRNSYGPARAVIGNNVLAHVDDTRDFLSGCAELIDDRGLVIIEAPYVRDLLDKLEYDTIYHEHLCYFSVTALMALAERAGLSIVRVDRVPVHGGSLRMYAARRSAHPGHAPAVIAMADEERALGLSNLDVYRRMAAGVRANREALMHLLEGLREAGSTIGGYGAPAKGNTLLNYCRIGTGLVPYTVDKNPMKVRLYTPGMHIPVLPVETLVERRPDYVLLLAWNFAEEIIAQQQEYRRLGGRFIIPIPEPRVV